MLIVGLTGGISSGKSTAANLFANLGVPIIDSDILAREVLSIHPETLSQIIAHFGTTICDTKGNLDRAQLRQWVFNNPQEKQWLETLLHPLIVSQIEQRIMQINAPYCIVVIPLLTESSLSRALVNRILVIDVAEDQQITRTQQRDKITVAEVEKMVQSQASRKQRLKIADDVIHNDGDLAKLELEVRKLHQRYLQLSS